MMWHNLEVYEVEKNLRTNIQKGLTRKQVEERKQKYGLNQLEQPKKENIVIKFLKQFTLLKYS